MKIINYKDKNLIEIVKKVLENGGLVVYPTETCYGAGVDATNSVAVTKLLKFKKRPAGKAISIACDSEKMAEEYVEISENAKKIYKNFLPGPVTVISKSKAKVDERLESEKGTLGIRISSYDLFRNIVKEFGKPITSTSANLSGEKTPYSIEDILENISEKRANLVDLIIDAGELPKNLPSTVIDTTTDEIQTYRQGKLKVKNEKLKNTKIKKFKSQNVEETIEIAKKILSANLNELDEKPLIILLRGELGAGKTHFTKGIAEALGINQIIKSPSYTYVEEYRIPPSLPPFRKGGIEGGLFHIDAWKISNKRDLDTLGFESWLKPGNILVIEWPEVVYNLGLDLDKLNAKIVEVELVDLGDDKREIVVIE